MNKEYELFGKKYESSTLLSVTLVLLSIIIVFFVIIPQFGNIGDQREKNSLKKNTVSELNTTLSTMQSTDAQKVDADLESVNRALPTGKDVISIFSTINELATSAEVQLRGFTIQVGDLYKKDQPNDEAIQNDISSVTGFPTVEVSITVGSDEAKNLVTFSNLLYKSMPIAKINELNAVENESTIQLSFYYRPYDLSQIQDVNKVDPYTNEYGSVMQVFQ